MLSIGTLIFPDMSFGNKLSLTLAKVVDSAKLQFILARKFSMIESNKIVTSLLGIITGKFDVNDLAFRFF